MATYLSKRRQLFINAYLVCWNATEAAKKAGYSDKTAYAIGYELLKHPQVADAIKRRVAESTMGAEEALSRLSDLARDAARDGDKIRALELVGKANRLFVDRVEQSGALKVLVEYADRDTEPSEVTSSPEADQG